MDRITSTKLGIGDLQKVITNCAKRMFKDLDTEVSLACLDLLEKGDFASLANISLDPSTYTTAWSFQKDYQAVSLFAKQSCFASGINTAEVALRKFMESEEQCRQTNLELKDRLRDRCHVHSIILIAAQKIEGWLDSVKMSNNDIRFGPGASSSCSCDSVSTPGKLQSRLDCSFKARWLIPRILSIPGFCNGIVGKVDDKGNSFSSLDKIDISILDSNTLVFVPKNSRSDRAICIEPHVNVMGQLAVGAALRRALRYAGLDLNHQAVRNNIRLARVGSIDGTYATIDLSSASDTIAYELVAKLLPIKWLELLDSLRTDYTKLPSGELLFVEKFSAMGNGYTFELESMIFYAISRATCEYFAVKGEISVFGDDIVCPTEIAGILIDVLETVGFKTNHEKTFITGPFRESCGHDFFSGTNVRPYFFKGEYYYHTDLFKVVNGIRSSAARFCNMVGPDGPFCDTILKNAWNVVFKAIPKNERCFGPRYMGDTVIWSPRSKAIASYKSQYGISTIHYVEVTPKKIGLGPFPLGVIISSLLLGSGSRISLRGVKGRTIKRTAVSGWSWNEGDWLG